MAVNVETLDKLERRISLSLPADEINKEVETRLKKLSRTVKADGFRPGKVPMSVVAQRYGYSVQYEVMNDKLGAAFAAAANEAKLRVAGTPRIAEKAESAEGAMEFDATSWATCPPPRSSASRPRWMTPRSTRPSRSCASNAARSRNARRPKAPKSAIA